MPSTGRRAALGVRRPVARAQRALDPRAKVAFDSGGLPPQRKGSPRRDRQLAEALKDSCSSPEQGPRAAGGTAADTPGGSSI